MGLQGLWVGLLLGDLVAALLSTVALTRCNWHAEAQKAWEDLQLAGA